MTEYIATLGFKVDSSQATKAKQELDELVLSAVTLDCVLDRLKEKHGIFISMEVFEHD